MMSSIHKLNGRLGDQTIEFDPFLPSGDSFCFFCLCSAFYFFGPAEMCCHISATIVFR
jgi:hypothetical protein